MALDDDARVDSQFDNDLSDTYTAQIESAMRAGWGDPRMDEYNDYDQHRASRSPS